MSGMTVFLDMMELLTLLAILFSMEAGKKPRKEETGAGRGKEPPAGAEVPHEEGDLMEGILALMQYGGEKKEQKEDKA